ncbi:hypothetical protein [Gloeobacter kilaueensis]|uniref:Uncharacterized protein n=1 Tax=Gloeobacter kilaueensis (strain ATCC BAA-2537 / CCAP 1431/1 / ULC 316 / JS1) TaxID=1183438 RepID=U5QLH2_GLOK1|nr:hypothetical protein [Gloeobacter kilaueensis]AGY58449.1 hypothetical protein GKIL_2203 [Gloeobacter kilaueensis JS1]
MNEPSAPYVPDEATHQRLIAQLRAVSAEMRAWSKELQAIQEMLDRDYEQSPIGQLHAKWAAENARLANGNTP